MAMARSSRARLSGRGPDESQRANQIWKRRDGRHGVSGGACRIDERGETRHMNRRVDTSRRLSVGA